MGWGKKAKFGIERRTLCLVIVFRVDFKVVPGVQDWARVIA